MTRRSNEGEPARARSNRRRADKPVTPKLDPKTVALTELLVELGVEVRLRKRQRLSARIDQTEMLYMVRSGVMMVEAGDADDDQIVLGMLFPGDAYRSSYIPPLNGGRLTALTRADVIRVRWDKFVEAVTADPRHMPAWFDMTAKIAARQLMHTAVLSKLSGEERVVALLVEMADRLGHANGRSVSCDLPLSRTDMASYLALNADTLSRIMSRLKSDGLVTVLGRGKLIIPNLPELCKRTPLCAQVRTLSNDEEASGDQASPVPCD